MSNVNALIERVAAKYNLDPAAWRAIIQNESGGNPGSIGDGGTSFGLTQLHIGGALGNMSVGQARQYLDPLKNLEFAGAQMAHMGLGGLRGRAAVDAYARRFERPANPAAEINVALQYYRSHPFHAGGGDSQPITLQPNGSSSAFMGQPSSPVQGSGDARTALLNTLMAGTSPQTPTLAGVNNQTQAIMQAMQGLGNGGLNPQGAPASMPLGNSGAVTDVKGMIAPGTSRVVALAKKYMGTKYVWGGTTPAGFDCSGFVQYLYSKQGIHLPRTTYEQIKVGQHVDMKHLQAGDIVFFSHNGDVHHEGLYIGNGQFIHAPHTGDVVKISSLSDPYYAQQFAGGRRV